jgi:hypothetical protein
LKPNSTQRADRPRIFSFVTSSAVSFSPERKLRKILAAKSRRESIPLLIAALP